MTVRDGAPKDPGAVWTVFAFLCVMTGDSQCFPCEVRGTCFMMPAMLPQLYAVPTP